MQNARLNVAAGNAKCPETTLAGKTTEPTRRDETRHTRAHFVTLRHFARADESLMFSLFFSFFVSFRFFFFLVRIYEDRLRHGFTKTDCVNVGFAAAIPDLSD